MVVGGDVRMGEVCSRFHVGGESVLLDCGAGADVVLGAADGGNGVMIVVMGISKLTVSFAAAILVMGIGLLMAGIGVVLAIMAIKLSVVVYPAIFRAVVNFVSGLFHGREANHR